MMVLASSVENFLFAPLPNGVIFALMIIGVLLSFRILDVADLSVEGVFPLVTVVTAMLINNGVNCWLAIIISMAIGAAAGLINAVLTLYLKIPPLLSGIIVMAGCFGLSIMANALNGGVSTFEPSNHLTAFNWLKYTLNGWGLPNYYANYLSIVIMGGLILAIVSLALYFFFGTELGMSIRASGKNKHMAKANGVNTNLAFMIGLVISGALMGLSASLYAQRNASGFPTDGQGMIVVGLSALFLGETIFGKQGFKRSLLSAIAGSFIYWYIIQILMLLDKNGMMLNFYKALLLVVVILLERLVGLLRHKISKGKGPNDSLKEDLSHLVLDKERGSK